jgi:cytochrome c oxidase subunit 2
VRRSRWARGGRKAALLGSLALLLSGCSASDWERNLRFGFPTGVTKQATRIRVLWTWSGVTALVLGVVVWGLIFWCCLRYRKKSDDLPRQTKYNFTVEAVCFAFPFLVIAGLFYRTVIVEDYVNKVTKNPDVTVQVDAFKWNWQFEYHTVKDASGKAQRKVYPGRTDLTDSSGTVQTRKDAAGGCGSAVGATADACGGPNADGQTSGPGPLYLSTVGSQNEIPILVVPVGKSVQVDEHSLDVIHSFWVPDFLFKRDVIPYGTTSTARDNKFEFTATTTGRFVGRCAELCGTYHSQMNFEVRVVPMSTFTAYLTALQKIGPDDPARQSKALAAAKMPAYATTTYPLTTDRNARAASQKQGG